MTKIALGWQYDHHQWLEEGLMALCSPPKPLSEEEDCELGLKDVIRCETAREKVREEVIRRSPTPGFPFLSSKITNLALRVAEEVFAEENTKDVSSSQSYNY
jgi:hypothetical protein